MSETTALEATTPETPAVAAPEPERELQVLVTEPGNMAAAQSGLVAWCDRKIAGLQEEQREALESYEVARKAKWRSSRLKAAAERYARRIVFYEKVREALLAGYVIVPDFPCEVFAIRAKRSRPVAEWKEYNWRSNVPDEKPSILPAGQGNYVNPSQNLAERKEREVVNGKETVHHFFKPVSYEDLEFPVALAHPAVMSATAEAMARRLFDEIACLPNRRRGGKGDPIVVGRIIDPTRGSPWSRHAITFFVAWWLRERDL